jgi:hypothetical protein
MDAGPDESQDGVFFVAKKQKREKTNNISSFSSISLKHAVI